MAKNKILAYAAADKTLQVRGMVMFGLLIIQFVVGMSLDLFIHLPDRHPGMSGAFLSRGTQGYWWALTNGGGGALTAHMVLATMLAAGSFATLGFAIAARNKTWIIAAGVGLLGVCSAFLNGLEFISTNQDKHSMAMAVAFIIALVAYGSGLYVGKIAP